MKKITKRMNYSFIFFLIILLVSVNFSYSRLDNKNYSTLSSEKDKTQDNNYLQALDPFLTNFTFDQVFWDSIDCIAVGDADNDGDNDIVIGTRPFGGLIVYENTGNENSVEFTQIVIANFSYDYYGALAFITDIVIADLDGTGNNSILVGTVYFTTAYFGDVVSFNKTNNVWQEEEFLNGGNKIQGGVYSLDVGEVGPSSENLVVVGQGFDSLSDNCSVYVYKKEFDTWIVENIVQTYQSRIRVSIGNFDPDANGNEIVYCSTSDNCTLGYVVYASGVVYHEIFGGFPGWPPEGFDWMDTGDLDGDGTDDAVVSVERYTADTNSIEIYNGFTNISLFSGYMFTNKEFVIDDFDNDGKDEVIFVYVTTTTYPDVQIMYIDWNGTAYETHPIENTIEANVPSIAVGDVDSDGVLETLYGTDGNGWLRLLDWIDDEFTVDCDRSPVVSLFEGIFSLTCTVQTHAWDIQGISVSLVLPGAINSTTPTTTIDIGDKFGPSSTIVEWQLDPFSYGIYNIDLTTTTANVGVNLTTLSVTITDLEVRNVLSSALTEEVGEYITLSGQVVFVHNNVPVEDAQVYLDGNPVTTTDPTGLFIFQHTEASSGLKSYNITATIDNEVKISKCAGYYIIQVEWTSAIPEYGEILFLSLLLPFSVASIFIIIKKKRKNL